MKEKTLPQVFIDARMVEGVPHGIGVYVADLARSLSAISNKPYEPVFILRESVRTEIESQEPWKNVARVFARSAFLHPSEWIELPRILRQGRAVLYHSPSFASLPRCPVPWVQTVHDLNHLVYGSLFQKLYYRAVLKPFARKSRSLITISEFSRKELRDWLGDSQFPIEIVSNVVSNFSNFIEARSSKPADVQRRFGVSPQRYLLCVSNPKPHKNLRLLVDAYREARTREPGLLADFPLLITAPQESFGGEAVGVKNVGALSSDEVSALMTGCAAFAFPSEYEGFGRPPVEAVALGAPVLVSDIPPHREGLRGVATDAVSFLSPHSRPDWATAIIRAARGAIPRPSQKDMDWVTETFSLSRMGKSMDRIYRDVLSLQA